MSLTTLQLARLKQLYEAYPQGWQPQDPYRPIFDLAIGEGFLRRVDGRCGVERVKDSHVRWTQAGALAMQSCPVTVVGR